MSRGLGKMQALIMDTLRGSGVPMSAAELRNEYLENLWLDVPDDDRDFSVWNTAERRRSVRMSMGRALRQLDAAGQIKRDGDGNWYPSKDWTGRDNAEREREWLACHEAAHAVIGLQGQLPLTVVHVNPEGDGATCHRHGPGELGASYQKVGSKYQLFDWSGVDAFGNEVKRVVLTDEQRHAHVRCSLAGGIAEAILTDEPDEWKKFASSRDMGNARHHRKKLGTSVKSWEKYVDEARALVRKHWAMIEAVAKALKEKGYLHAQQVENICNRLTRRQHVKQAVEHPGPKRCPPTTLKTMTRVRLKYLHCFAGAL